MSEKPKYLGHCGTCGVIVRRDGEYCSSGCYLAGRLPFSAEGLSASWQLGVMLAAGFALFNQLVFWLLAWKKLLDEEFELATRFGWISLGLGIALLGFWLFVFVISRFRTWVDLAIILVSLGVMTSALRNGMMLMTVENLMYFFVGNGLLAIWFGRGLFALWLSKKQEKRS